MSSPLAAPTSAGAAASTSTEAPPPPAAVTSNDYLSDGAPRGGVGLPGTFEVIPPTTRAHEVKEYAYSLESGVVSAAETVAARSTDHGASITVAPRHDGINVLHVWSKSHAGRISTMLTYMFFVRADSGPAARWTFEETGAAATDVSGHGNALTLGEPAVRVAGRSGVGTALSLPGTTAATRTAALHTPHPFTGASTPMRTDASFTVAAWARISSTSGGDVQTVVSASGSRTSAYYLGYAGGDQRWRFSMAAADTDDAALHSVLSDAAPTVDRWTHLAGVYDASTKTMTLYVNGVAQAATTTLVGGFDATAEVAVGKRRWNGGDDGFFTGLVDDVRVYTSVETSTELAKLAVPLPPTVTFPHGSEVTGGGQITVRFDARGDTNVIAFRYSMGDAGLGSTVNAATPGGTATVTLDVGDTRGSRPVYAAAVADGNRVSDKNDGEFTVRPATSLSGNVWNEYFLPLAGAVVQLQPGGYQTTSAADGSYALTGVPPGVYTVTATFGGECGLSHSALLEIDGQGLTFDFFLGDFGDDPGDACPE
ncbi:LamG-like jellyroll fold domain-containing protein [Micromonospora sp. NPDC003816]|uniref:LamG-like jellyroll fold domain-containing protein n=1 Tax=Micromonospora sp. NPDC003816 TaxID=3364224 RepID=UPI0036B6AEBF